MSRLFVAVFGMNCSYTVISVLLLLHAPKTAPGFISTMAVNQKCVCLIKVYSFSMIDASFDEFRRLEAAMVLDTPLPGLDILDTTCPAQMANVVSSIFLVWKQTHLSINEITIFLWVVPFYTDSWPCLSLSRGKGIASCPAVDSSCLLVRVMLRVLRTSTVAFPVRSPQFSFLSRSL
jgi:hypothetical protein